MAWEQPQRRAEERIRKAIPLRLETDGYSLDGLSRDVSLTGISLEMAHTDSIPSIVNLTAQTIPPFTCQAHVVYHEPVAGRARCGLAFVNLNEEHRRAMVLTIFTDPATWSAAHRASVRSKLLMAGHLLAGLWRSLAPLRTRRRRTPRTRLYRLATVQIQDHRRTVLLRNRSAGGIGFLLLGSPLPSNEEWTIQGITGSAHYRSCYRKLIAPGIWRFGATSSSADPVIPDSAPSIAAPTPVSI